MDVQDDRKIYWQEGLCDSMANGVSRPDEAGVTVGSHEGDSKRGREKVVVTLNLADGQERKSFDAGGQNRVPEGRHGPAYSRRRRLEHARQG